jgi:hypothetical protein
MRTKTLAVTAALGLAGIATSLAQVYSVNTVGYINLTLNQNFNLIANQLDNKQGNTIPQLFGTAVPDGTIVYGYANPGGFSTETLDFGLWGPEPHLTAPPGSAIFVRIPPGSPATTVTMVGEVMQGNPLTIPLKVGFNAVASMVPQAGKLVADLKYTPADGDIVYQYKNATGYDTKTYEFGEWTGGEPDLAVGEGIFIKSVDAKSWNRNFTIP